MNNFKVGDKIAVLDDVIEGIIIKIGHKSATINTTDDFELDFSFSEIVLIQTSNELNENLQKVNFNIVSKEKEIPKPRLFVKEKKSKKDDFVLEIDLHIEKLIPNKKGLSNFDILNIQTEAVKKQLEFAQRNKIPKIVFIHGVGEGVLKAEIDFLLGRYDNIKFQDANYQKYGLGATEVYFVQNKNNLKH